jgi:peroxiredoxin Q/BCP
MLTDGDNIPPFELQSANGTPMTNKDIHGKKSIFYFYPKDDTPGCTKEGQAFSDHFAKFKELGVTVYGISKCSVKKHEKFCTKYSFQHELLSDENSQLCEDFGVWVEKRMYGKKYMGIERSTFMIDEHGTIVKSWTKVKVPGHIEDVLNAVQDIWC